MRGFMTMLATRAIIVKLMSALKTITLAALFLIPSFVIGALLVVLLLAIGYNADAGPEIGAMQAGVWALCCGFYFKNNPFKWASLALITYSIIALIVKAG